MRIEKHTEAIKEVLDEIEKSLSDPKGILSHQRRLALIISLGVVNLIEVYFHKLEIMKMGASLKHQWLKRSDIKDLLSKQISSDIDSIKSIDQVISISKDIEEKRNILAYGSPINEEQVLLDQINAFLEIKKMIEKETGDTI